MPNNDNDHKYFTINYKYYKYNIYNLYIYMTYITCVLNDNPPVRRSHSRYTGEPLQHTGGGADSRTLIGYRIR